MFEIIQDGGRHLEFVRIENSAIRSAVPENPTLEPNMKWIGRPVAEVTIHQLHRQTDRQTDDMR